MPSFLVLRKTVQQVSMPDIFIILFSILILYQDQYIISKNRFLDALKGLQNASSLAINNNKAYIQSYYGFFDGGSNTNWELHRQRYQSQHHHMDNSVRNSQNYINVNHIHTRRRTAKWSSFLLR
mmetsp:Transcript_45614/g.68802  ORF Transcript_45614/g.68802 Transcript_45614/m.68802 type:complete len:124 (+) Transcript_45614:1986-2357(+)